jgi:hypothetical protein
MGKRVIRWIGTDASRIHTGNLFILFFLFGGTGV